MNPSKSRKEQGDDFTIFTVCNLAYLPKALVLADSVARYQNQKLRIYLFDKKTETDLSKYNADFFWIEDLRVPDFKQLAFKYDIIEFSTCLKPFITIHLLNIFENVIFLDPDTCLFADVFSILEDLNKNSIVLTPHYTTPQSNNLAESDTGMLRFGSFNLGFYAVRRSDESLSFLNWWSQRCIDLCYMDSQFGLSTDQKWVTIAPCFFKDIYISFNLGYNFAAWNSWERKLSKDTNGNYIVNEVVPLTFFHFSNFDPADPQYLNKRSCYETSVNRPDLLEIGEWYSKELDTKKSDFSIDKYAYDYMSGGEYISPTLRRAYACILGELPHDHNPFDSDGVVGKFARNNHLFEQNNKPYQREGFGSVSSSTRKLSFIYFILRVILRIVGPNKFMNISRLMVYLSSYRLNRGLWKY
jgi:hypothetical protein